MLMCFLNGWANGNNGIYELQNFVYNDRIHFFFDQKELQIKMSSFLSFSNGSSKSEHFSLKDIEVFVDSEEQNWFKREHVGKFLRIEDIRISG